MLKENQLFGVHDLVKIAIDRLQYFESQALSMQPFGSLPHQMQPLSSLLYPLPFVLTNGFEMYKYKIN